MCATVYRHNVFHAGIEIRKTLVCGVHRHANFSPRSALKIVFRGEGVVHYIYLSIFDLIFRVFVSKSRHILLHKKDFVIIHNSQMSMMSGGCQVDVRWMSSGCRVDVE